MRCGGKRTDELGRRRTDSPRLRFFNRPIHGSVMLKAQNRPATTSGGDLINTFNAVELDKTTILCHLQYSLLGYPGPSLFGQALA